MTALLTLALLACGPQADAPGPDSRPATERFSSPKYGVQAEIPKEWFVAEREHEGRVFVALVPQGDPLRPGVVACELALAPENLEQYRTRIEANARRANAGGKLAGNAIVKREGGERLESLKEFRPASGGLWHELSVYMIAHRQLYTWILNVDDATYPKVRPMFDALVESARLTPPNTGADVMDRKANRWSQREFKFALDLPESWEPVLAPAEVALLFANGPAKGVWSDNLLVLAAPHKPIDFKSLVEELPRQLQREEPGCEVLSCEIRPRDGHDELETVVRTRRGPFSMTVLERRFRGGRFDYELKFTVESERFDAMAPALRKCLDSFRELPGAVPGLSGKAA